MKLFSIVTLSLVFLLFAAADQGGVWVWSALLYSTAFTFLMDHLLGAKFRSSAKKPAKSPRAKTIFTSSFILSALLGWLHFVLLAVMIWAVAAQSGLSGWERLGVFMAYGLFFGQISHPNAHELIHRSPRNARRLGRMIYSSLLVGHHASAHRLVHHVHVATKRDPSSAQRGLGFYYFAFRAAHGAFRAGLHAETKRLVATDGHWWQHPYIEYASVSLAALVLAFSLAGFSGVLALLFVSIYTQLQMLLSDYVQHYGLRRARLVDGRPEPIGPQHSWNSPHVFSSALMLNAPRHSDHHSHPMRPFPALRLEPETMPMLPYPLPIMAILALWPARWRALMDPLCEAWKPGWEQRHRTHTKGTRLTGENIGKIAPEMIPASLRAGFPAGMQARIRAGSAHENPRTPQPNAALHAIAAGKLHGKPGDISRTLPRDERGRI